MMFHIYSQYYEIEEKLAEIDKSIYQIYLTIQQCDISSNFIEREVEYQLQHPTITDIRKYLEGIAIQWNELVRKKKFLESIEPSGYSDYPYKIKEPKTGGG